MRVCLVSHQFLPDNMAGVEIYVHRTARALIDAGHEVLVFTTRKDLTRAECSVLREDYEGVPTLRLIRNLFHEDLRTTFRDERVERAFEREVLEGFGPDVVHPHHLIHLSMGIPRLCAERGVPVAMTLHDYWLQCPRFGRLLSWGGHICESIEPERCSKCLQTFSWRNPPKLRPVAAVLRGVRSVTGLDAQGPLQRVFRKRTRSADLEFEEPQVDADLLVQLAEREAFVREEFAPHVARFLCPSKFLRSRLIDFGLDQDRALHHPYGVPRPGPEWSKRERSGPLRFAYCASVLPHKGAHVVLEAFAQLVAERGPDCARLAIHGGWASDPSYGERITRRGRELGVTVSGGYAPSEIDRLLAEADALVTPSVWFENQPITILDARVRGLPCLVSEFGGMTELVADAELRFAVGDAADCARAMGVLVDEPERGVVGEYVPPTPVEDLDATLQVYEQIRR